jgi:hypothetical protein
METLQSETTSADDLRSYKGQWVRLSGGLVESHSLDIGDLGGEGTCVFFVPPGGFALPSDLSMGDYEIVDEADLSMLAVNSVAGEVSATAVPWRGAWGGTGVFGDWYMPAPSARLQSRWGTIAIAAVIVGFLVIDAFGLCITTGVLSIA